MTPSPGPVDSPLMDITVIGTGYVGLVTGACFAELGHNVTCLDIDEEKLTALRSGIIPIFEPGLEGLIRRAEQADRIRFVSDYGTAITDATAVFIAVGTPSSGTGKADLSQVDAAVEAMAPHLGSDTTVVMKSTVPVGTTRRISETLSELRPDLQPPVGSNPEFLKQGAAVEDFMHPDRIVIGSLDAKAEDTLRHIYQPLLRTGAPVLFTDLETAELVKYASNTFLATKLSFINEMADLCEQTGASIGDVATGMGMDSRISESFLQAGPGYGGSCFPKDTQALLHESRAHGAPSRIVAAAVDVNHNRKSQMIDKVVNALGGTVAGLDIGALGVTFKANTDDLRDSPAIEIIRGLIGLGATVRAYDPQGMERARDVLPSVVFVQNPYEVAESADGLVILTEWSEFATLNLDRIGQALRIPVVIDLRNLYEPADVASAGLAYYSVGRLPAIPEKA
jgi:UDPglucose 6-dehydrogenase